MKPTKKVAFYKTLRWTKPINSLYIIICNYANADIGGWIRPTTQSYGLKSLATYAFQNPTGCQKAVVTCSSTVWCRSAGRSTSHLHHWTCNGPQDRKDGRKGGGGNRVKGGLTGTGKYRRGGSIPVVHTGSYPLQEQPAHPFSPWTCTKEIATPWSEETYCKEGG